jgi:ABC-2 type transport system ATP-binding protein
MRALCDRVAWIEGGRLVQLGPAPEVVDAYTGGTHEDRETTATGATRWGSGEVRITSVELLDSDGRPTTQVRTGDGITVRVAFTAPTRVLDPIFGVSIEHIDGHTISGTTTLRQGQTVAWVEGPGSVEAYIPALPLAEGTYDVSVAVVDRSEKNPYDYWRRPIRFDVLHGDRVVVGYVDLGCQFKLDKIVGSPAEAPDGIELSR